MHSFVPPALYHIRESSVKEGLCPGGVSVTRRVICPGRSLSSGVSSPWGVLCPGVPVTMGGSSVQGGSLFMGGPLSRGVSVQGRSLSRMVSVQEVSVQGVSVQGRPLSRGSLSRGSLSRGVLCPEGDSVTGGISSPCGQTDTCEIITLPQTSFAGGKNPKIQKF